jgi:hypothetical protein
MLQKEKTQLQNIFLPNKVQNVQVSDTTEGE